MVVGELVGAQLERGRFGRAGLELLGRVVGVTGAARLLLAFFKSRSSQA